MNDTPQTTPSPEGGLPPLCAAELEKRLRPEFFKALCDPVRISIVAMLAMRCAPVSVADVAEGCAIDYSGVSRHLKILREAGVVTAERRGRDMLYAMPVEPLAETLRAMADALEACREEIERH